MQKTPFRRCLLSVLMLSGLLLAAGTSAQTGDAGLPPADPAQLARCLRELQPQAAAKGMDAAFWRAQTGALEPDRSVLKSLDYQPEFRTPIWDYLATLVDEDRIEEGRRQLLAQAGTLDAVREAYGVDPATIVAVWGVESNFGQRFGKLSLLRSLATLSCFGRRQKYFTGEFLTTLQIIQQGHIAADRLLGSWAGAFGHTQFMPSTFMRTAVDFDGDGRRDIIGSVPDALASTANYLVRAGWRTGQPWGLEVRLPDGLSLAGQGRKSKRPLSEWMRAGIKQADGSALDPAALGLTPASAAGLIVPASRDVDAARAPAFLVFRNFDAIYSYNAAESYALAIAHLADRLRGGGPFLAPWPTDDPGLGRSERRELQTLLLASGHDIGEVDGYVGSRTRAAIAVEERRLGWPETGRAGLKILNALRGARQ